MESAPGKPSGGNQSIPSRNSHEHPMRRISRAAWSSTGCRLFETLLSRPPQFETSHRLRFGHSSWGMAEFGLNRKFSNDFQDAVYPQGMRRYKERRGL